MSFPITITPSAIVAARAGLVKRGTPEGAVRLGIKGGGCSGFKYSIAFDDSPPSSTDAVLECDDIKFYVDAKSALYLSGSIFDWVEHGMISRGFEFKNPNIKSECGCGSSFAV
jgi:iron-sulfur cluster assembly protein